LSDAFGPEPAGSFARRGLTRVEKVSCLGLPNCYRLTNGTVEVTVATDVGPRVLGYRLVGGENVLGEAPNAVITTPFGDWKPWGGHRLWAAPEVNPRSYVPDNSPVGFEFEGERKVRLIGATETQTCLQKVVSVTLDPEGAGVTVRHRITNRGQWAVELSLWALTILNCEGGGQVFIPQEPYRSWGHHLAPARPLVLWHYTDLTDARLRLGRKLIRLRTDDAAEDTLKIGALNKQGWAAYLRGTTLFVKRYGYEEGAAYPDYGCNTEAFTAGPFIELETLSPLRRLEPGETASHEERWHLFPDFDPGATEEALAEAIERLLPETE
jgi:hypothetical protein